jgi:hypothetical protein
VPIVADTAKGERKAHWQERKEIYIEHLRKANEDILIHTRRRNSGYLCSPKVFYVKESIGFDNRRHVLDFFLWYEREFV